MEPVVLFILVSITRNDRSKVCATGIQHQVASSYIELLLCFPQISLRWGQPACFLLSKSKPLYTVNAFTTDVTMLFKWRKKKKINQECCLSWNRVSPQKHLRELSQGRFVGQTATTAKVLFQPSPSIKPLLQLLTISMETEDVGANRD